MLPPQLAPFFQRCSAWLLTGALAAGCLAIDPAETAPLTAPAVVADRATFAHEAGPLLEKRCGAAVCHGRDLRPFALFAAGNRRLDPAQTMLKAPLTPAELDANHAAVLGFLDTPRPRDTTLIRKALGQLGHKGGAVFAAPSDPECQAITAWILGEVAP